MDWLNVAWLKSWGFQCPFGLDSRVEGRMVKADELVSVVEESNRALQTSREQLMAALENSPPALA